MNTNAFRNLSYGVYIISTLDGERPTGCVANSAMQITSLSEESDATLIGTFGFQSGKEVNKFDGVQALEKEGIPVIADACAYVVCKVIDKMETATHTVFLGEVIDADVLKKAEPMTYAYYHKVVKGKSPKNAPTYLPEEKEEKADDAKWVCSICGYVYDGETPFEELPEDFRCPICKQPKEKFVKQ